MEPAPHLSNQEAGDVAVSWAGAIEPVRTSWPYLAGLAGLAGAAAVMLLMVVLYVLIIAGALALVWWHVSTNTWLLGSGGIFGLTAYVTPAFAGLVLALFLVKPLFVTASREGDRVHLALGEHPALAALIGDVCRQIRAPMPVRVDVDCEPNASARLAPGLASFLRRDLVLTIGLPLAAGLTVRQLSGVIAHELGHFTQGGGIRLSGLVRGLNRWFHRVVHERDAWDERLIDGSKAGDARTVLLWMAASVCVWVSRRLLHGLMLLGHGVSAFLLRQMEFDADRREIAVVGSRTFVETMAQMRTLGVAAHIGNIRCQEMWQRQFLPSDLPSFVAAQGVSLPDDVRSALSEGAERASTGYFDTHPSDHARVRAAEMAGKQGVLVGGAEPSGRLFADFAAVSATATRHHYERRIGLELEHIQLVDAEHLTHDGAERDDGRRALEDMFGDCYSVKRPLCLPIDELRTLDDSAAAAALAEARTAMIVARSADLPGLYERVRSLVDVQHRAFAAEECLMAGVAIDVAMGFEADECSMEGATAKGAACLEQQAALAPALIAFEQRAARRLAAAAVLGARQGHARALLLAEAVNRLGAAIPDILVLCGHIVAAQYLMAARGQVPPAPGLEDRLSVAGGRAYHCVERLKTGLGDLQVPDGPSGALVPVSKWLGGSAGPNVTADEIVTRVFGLYMRSLVQLCAIAAGIERDAPCAAAL